MKKVIKNTEGLVIKDITIKPQFQLIDPNSTLGLACALTHGAHLYAPYSWRDVPMTEYIGALDRHFNAYCRGEIFDPKSHLFHLDHLNACSMFLRWDLMKNKRNKKYINEVINQGLYIPKEAMYDCKNL